MLVLIALSCQHFQIGTSDGVTTMLVDAIFAIIFIFFPFSLFHSLLRPFLTEGVFGSKEWFGAANDLFQLIGTTICTGLDMYKS